MLVVLSSVGSKMNQAIAVPPVLALWMTGSSASKGYSLTWFNRLET